MATINLNDINLAGADLFFDSESYLNEMTGDDITKVHGGVSPASPPLYSAAVALSAVAIFLAGAIVSATAR